jgi:hypothetical protein
MGNSAFTSAGVGSGRVEEIPMGEKRKKQNKNALFGGGRLRCE